MQNKQELVASKVKIIEETTVTDLTVTQQIVAQSREATSSQNQNSNTVTVPASKALTNIHEHSADFKNNVVIYGVKENPNRTPNSTHAKSDVKSCVQILKQTNDKTLPVNKGPFMPKKI